MGAEKTITDKTATYVRLGGVARGGSRMSSHDSEVVEREESWTRVRPIENRAKRGTRSICGTVVCGMFMASCVVVVLSLLPRAAVGRRSEVRKHIILLPLHEMCKRFSSRLRVHTKWVSIQLCKLFTSIRTNPNLLTVLSCEKL